MLRFPTRVATVLSMALLLAACGGGTGPKTLDVNFYPDLPGPDLQEETGTDAFSGRDTGDEEQVVVPTHRYEIIFLEDTSEPLQLLVGGKVPIRVKVIDYADPTPAIGVDLAYQITAIEDADQNPSDGDAYFAADQVQTDSNAVGSNEFNAGETPDRLYTITVSIPDTETEPKTLQVLVSKAPCGCANVSLSYEGGLPASALKAIEVHVFPSDYGCDKLFPEKPLPESIADRTIANLYGTTSFECLPAGSYYTFFAKAKRGTPGTTTMCPVASGCNDSAFLQPDTCKDLKLKLYLATMNPTGQYDSIDHFDFTNLVKQCAGGDTTMVKCVTGSGGDIGKSICCVLAELIKLFETPTVFIVDNLAEVAKQFLPGIIVDTVINIFKNALSKIIDDWILHHSPQFIQDFFKIGNDLLQIITNLEMLSDLMISKLQNDFSVQGTHFWYGIALYWKLGCDPKDPNYASCGRIQLSLKDLQNTQFPIDLLEGKFTASVADFDKLILNQHAIKLNYGKLVLFVLNELIIANLTGGKAHTLKEVVHMWLDCAAISQGVLGEIASWFGGSASDIEGVCNTTIDFLFGYVDVFLNALTLDTEMALQGNGLMIDKDCDLRVDEIINGKYVGYVQGSSVQQASITGDFHAIRKK